MITKIAFIGLAGFLFIQSFFQLSEVIFTQKKDKEWQEYLNVERAVEEGKYEQAISKLEFLLEQYKRKKDEELLKQAMYTLTLAYYKKKYLQEMLKMAKELIRLYPDDEVGKAGFFFAGEYYMEEKNYDYAVASYEMFIKKLPNHPFVPLAYFNIAKILYENKKYDEAEDILKKMERKFSRSSLMPQVKRFLLTLYLDTDRPKEAIKRIKAIEHSPDFVEINNGWLSIAEYFYNKGDYAQAIDYYSRIRDKESMLKEIEQKIQRVGDIYERERRIGLTQYYYDRGEQRTWWKEFDYQALYRDVKESKDLYPYALFKIGCCYFELGNYEEAEKKFSLFEEKKYGVVDPELASNVNYYKTLVYLKTNRMEELAKYSKATGQSEDVEFALLQALYNDNKFKMIAENYKQGKYRFKKPQYEELGSFLVAESFFMANLYKEAIELYKEFIKKFPKSQYLNNARINLASSYKESQYYNEAIREFEQLLSVYPNDSRYTTMILLQLGDAYNKLKNYERSIYYYKLFLDKFPDHSNVPDVLIILGNVCFELKKYESSMQYYTKLINSYPDNRNVEYALYYIGMCYKELGNYAKMVETFEKLTTQFPEGEAAAQGLYWTAWAYRQQKQFEKAINTYDLLCSKFPNHKIALTARLEKAEALHESGQSELALEEYTNMLNSFANSNSLEDIYYLLGKIIEFYKKNQRLDEIPQFFDKLSKKFDSQQLVKVAIQLKLGEFYYTQKKIKEASEVLSQLESVINRINLSPQEIYSAADILFKAQQYEKSYSFFKKLAVSYPNNKQYLRNSIWGLCECYIKLGEKGAPLSTEVKNLVEKYYVVVSDIKYVNFALGKSYWKLGEYEKCIPVLKNVVGAFEKSEGAEVTYMIAHSYQQLSKYEEAIKYYARMVLVYNAYEEWMPQTYYNAGLCYLKIGDTKKAKELFTEIVNRYPNSKYYQLAKQML
jgi:tetratricopeptide (TPR) repeat protein